ncbi:hypothetical protein GOP47_0019090 [Adiantum capillus-veneris]|uniref:Endonuclease/exonuclease/phosphatase domain-containing protein n=1 Tax=Adiantum capillus-veneris TaxID=13818 RepID=A0A9D4UFT1_ADICA|nr:hypothetical protein GOP47_0019090 [Adiantum capillus-veneris]
MQLGKCISLIKECRARSAIAVFWRQQGGVAAANRQKSKELELELDDHSNLEATQAPSRHFERYSRTEEPQKRAFTSLRRVWKRAPCTSHTFPQERFTITSFNILASELVQKHRFLYSSVQPFHLHWNRRKAKILQGLDISSSDIICLQEVDKFADLEETLASRGYIGLYKRRTGETPDGCAIFWKKTRFRLLQERSFEFSMLDMRNNVAQLCVLQLTVPDAERSPTLSRCNDQIQSLCLVVGNIHVLYNPKRGDIKLGQCRAFLEQVHNMSTIWHGAPVVIGGDFNSTPSSAVYKYLATSELELSNLDRTLVSGLVPEELDRNENKSGKEWSAHRNPSLWNAVDKGALQEEILDNLDTSSQHVALRLEERCDNDSTGVPVSNLEFTEAVFADSSDPRLTTMGNSNVFKDRYGWDVEGLRLATGKDNCTRVRHDLTLYSTYSDIQGFPGTRDALGEPLLTTCHKKFLGTVDYIWRNDGLKTLRVLDTLPVTSLSGDKGLPIMVWGSDHLPLACEIHATWRGSGDRNVVRTGVQITLCEDEG